MTASGKQRRAFGLQCRDSVIGVRTARLLLHELHVSRREFGTWLTQHASLLSLLSQSCHF